MFCSDTGWQAERFSRRQGRVPSQGYSTGTLHTLQTDDPVSAHDQVTLPNTTKGQLAVQVVDDAEGPSTKREFEVARVPVGAALCGQVVDFLGCPHGSQYQLGTDAQLPLLNDQLDMKSREQINSSSFTGIKVMLKPPPIRHSSCLSALLCCKSFLAVLLQSKFQLAFHESRFHGAVDTLTPLQAVDTLTPLGRGQAQLLVGPAASGKSSLAVDAILGQHMQQQAGQQPVRCVYASVGHRYACKLACKFSASPPTGTATVWMVT